MRRERKVIEEEIEEEDCKGRRGKDWDGKMREGRDRREGKGKEEENRKNRRV